MFNKIVFIFLSMLICENVLANDMLTLKHSSYSYFTVSADAEVRVQPNRLSISFGVLNKDKDLNSGKNKMHEVITKAVAYCKGQGVKEKNIQIAEIQVRPVYRYDSNLEDDVLKHYEFNQSFVVVLEDFSKYENIVYSLLGMGINKIDNVNLYSTDMLKYRNESRKNAIQAAKDKATLLSTETGLTLGKIVSVNEGSSYSHRNIFYNNIGSNVSQNISQASDWEASGTGELSVGMIPVKSSVTLVYEVIH